MWWIFRLACLVLVAGTARWWWPMLRSLPAERRLRQWVVALAAIGVLGFALAQLIPFGWSHSNPPVVREPAWDGPPTRELTAAACFDCHSNEVRWPWYTNVAPISWLVINDVGGGRDHLNFSDWNGGSRSDTAREAARAVEGGSMPPGYYTWLHPSARLTVAEQAALAEGLRASLVAP